MDFTISPALEDLRSRIAAFVARELIPLESDLAAYDPHENISQNVLTAMRAKARAEGLWCLQIKPENGGRGVGRVGMAVCYEEMNRSIFGPVVFNSAAPDDGNMMMLEAVGTPDQRARWLAPIVRGEVRSAFAMTEPHPSGGSDPSMIRTRAEKQADGSYRIHGRKWFITGAEGAAHFTVIARTSDDERHGLTAFLFHKDQPGWRILRRIPIMGPEEHGGHCEIEFEGLAIPAEDVLLGEGEGLKVAQIRLGPARLTHCMRWLGLAKRSLEIAGDYVKERQSGVIALAAHEAVQGMLGDAAMQIQMARLLTLYVAWKLDQGERARSEVSMAKV